MKKNFTFLPFHFKQLSFKLTTKMTSLLLGSSMLLFALHSQAQVEKKPKLVFSDVTKRSALSLQLGGNVFFGDLGGNSGTGRPFIKDINLQTTRLFVGAGYSYFPLRWLSINGDLHFTGVTSADSLVDAKLGHAFGRYQRNLSSQSFIYELQTTAQFYPLQFINKKSTTRLMPYVGTGIGLFHFNPKAKLNGQFYYLKPLHTEGEGFAEYPERENYHLTQFYIPFTVGVGYRLNENNLISVNAIFRKTFTDYIDDASTTYVDPSLFDKYLSAYAANIAKQLYYRGISSSTPRTNDYRGYAGNDSYTSVFITFTHLLK